MYKQRLEEYIEKDKIYQAYKKQKEIETSDFDNFCISHCEDIEEALFDLEQLRKENNQLKEQCEKQRYAITENCDLRLEIEQLKEQIQELKADYGTQAQVERDFYKSVIDELRSWLEEYKENSYGLGSYETGISDALGDVLRKLNELEGKND